MRVSRIAPGKAAAPLPWPAVIEAWFERDPEAMPLVRLVSLAGAELAGFARRQLAVHGLSPVGFGVLCLAERGEGGALRDLAARLGVTPATLTPVIDALEAAGHLDRSRDPVDRRVVALALTPRGRACHATARTTFDAALCEHFPAMLPEQEAAVRAYLIRVLAAVGA